MGNVFAGIEDTERDGARRRNDYLTDGTYLVELEKFIARESTHPDRAGEAMVIVEATVIEVTRDVEGTSLPPGKRFASIYKLPRAQSGALTTTGERNMGRVKAIVAALLGGADDSEITAAVCADLAQGDGQALKGVRVLVDASTTFSKSSNKPFTNLSWEFPG